jgi:hypothetical protein
VAKKSTVEVLESFLDVDFFPGFFSLIGFPPPPRAGGKMRIKYRLSHCIHLKTKSSAK